jgi:hypothetical protein
MFQANAVDNPWIPVRHLATTELEGEGEPGVV